MRKSQVEVDEIIRSFVSEIKITTPEDLLKLKEKIHSSLTFLPYSGENIPQEAKVRWTRTASEIISSGYVYEGKACSDLVVIFIACCNALKIKSNLVRLPSHSIAEAKIIDNWYTIDAGGIEQEIIPGRFPDSHASFRGRARDFWDWKQKFK